MYQETNNSTLQFNRKSFITRADKSSCKSNKREDAFKEINKSNNFLNFKFRNKKNTDIIYNYLINEISDFKPTECLDELEKCVENEFRLRNKKFKYKRQKSFNKNISSLYYSLSAILPHGHKLNIDYDYSTNRLIFIEYTNTNFPDYSLFFLPISILTRVKGDIRNILLCFFKYLIDNCHFNIPYDQYDFYYVLNMDDNEESIIEFDKDSTEFVNEYKNGFIKSLFDEIKSCNINDLFKLIDKYKKENDKEYIELIECIEEGIKLNESDSIFNYDYRDDSCNITSLDVNDGDLDISRIFCLVYDTEENDIVTSNSIEFLNNDWQDLEPYNKNAFRIIKKDDTSCELNTEFPEVWNEWFIKIYNLIII